MASTGMTYLSEHCSRTFVYIMRTDELYVVSDTDSRHGDLFEMREIEPAEAEEIIYQFWGFHDFEESIPAHIKPPFGGGAPHVDDTLFISRLAHIARKWSHSEAVKAMYKQVSTRSDLPWGPAYLCHNDLLYVWKNLNGSTPKHIPEAEKRTNYNMDPDEFRMDGTLNSESTGSKRKSPSLDLGYEDARAAQDGNARAKHRRTHPASDGRSSDNNSLTGGIGLDQNPVALSGVNGLPSFMNAQERSPAPSEDLAQMGLRGNRKRLTSSKTGKAKKQPGVAQGQARTSQRLRKDAEPDLFELDSKGFTGRSQAKGPGRKPFDSPEPAGKKNRAGKRPRHPPPANALDGQNASVENGQAAAQNRQSNGNIMSDAYSQNHGGDLLHPVHESAIPEAENDHPSRELTPREKSPEGSLHEDMSRRARQDLEEYQNDNESGTRANGGNKAYAPFATPRELGAALRAQTGQQAPRYRLSGLARQAAEQEPRGDGSPSPPPIMGHQGLGHAQFSHLATSTSAQNRVSGTTANLQPILEQPTGPPQTPPHRPRQMRFSGPDIVVPRHRPDGLPTFAPQDSTGQSPRWEPEMSPDLPRPLQAPFGRAPGARVNQASLQQQANPDPPRPLHPPFRRGPDARPIHGPQQQQAGPDLLTRIKAGWRDLEHYQRRRARAVGLYGSAQARIHAADEKARLALLKGDIAEAVAANQALHDAGQEARQLETDCVEFSNRIVDLEAVIARDRLALRQRAGIEDEEL
ncbi:hypothetical protein K491DRAFT_714211 [Lophiostoma macrostomum CBS 122681]|uniref:Uncharacterized protein n=1 Tax=Lophiostoma macrostomum CBS 122681 TaxID=1314788 RepID=A0A6A6TFI2_9PLEO|nr:hypothetical protein K491DRAFT_714211 [Lophiostoma macrostomum CBS 122681]